MTLNPTKCQLMQICFMKHPPPAPEIIIDSQILQETTHARVLGVHLQNDLKWTTHVNYMLQRANGRLYMLRVLKSHGLSLSKISALCWLRETFSGICVPSLEWRTNHTINKFCSWNGWRKGHSESFSDQCPSHMLHH